jgi:hypothetical protein
MLQQKGRGCLDFTPAHVRPAEHIAGIMAADRDVGEAIVTMGMVLAHIPEASACTQRRAHQADALGRFAGQLARGFESGQDG